MAKRSIGNYSRIQNVSSIQTVKSSAAVLHRIVLSNAAGAAATLTLTDGSTVVNVLNIAALGSAVFDLGINFSTSLKVTPSASTVDVVVIYT